VVIKYSLVFRRRGLVLLACLPQIDTDKNEVYYSRDQAQYAGKDPGWLTSLELRKDLTRKFSWRGGAIAFIFDSAACPVAFVKQWPNRIVKFSLSAIAMKSVDVKNDH
jgi:hypothetical protein